jgi:hypothetical protein
MAGDWIKIEHGLLGKPEVMLLADTLDASPYEVVGHLVAFWLWVDLNLSPDCPQVKGTKKGLDRVAGRDGFSDALISVGWLYVEDGVVSIPGYEVHLSKSAKERAKGQKKKAMQRIKLSPSEGDKNGTKGGTREEKRREELLNTPLAPQGGEVAGPPKKDQDLQATEPPPGEKPKRKPKETVGEFLVPARLDSPEIREALKAFERMRVDIGHRIKDRSRLCLGWDKAYRDKTHLLDCIQFATANEYQGIKPRYIEPERSQATGKPIKRESDLPKVDSNWEPA